MPKKKMRNRRNMPFRHVFVFSVLLFIGVTVWGLWIINAGIKPVLLNIAEIKAKQIATYGINYGIKKKEVHEMKRYMQQAGVGEDQMIHVEKNNDGEITAINYNTYIIAKLLTGTTQDVQEYLRSIEEGTRPIYNTSGQMEILEKEKGVVAHIPLGQATNNVLLSNLGPNVPVKFEVVSNVTTDIKKEMKQIGINNVFITLSIHVEVEVQVVIPFGTRPVKVSADIPIASDFFPGKVPLYWGGNGGDNASIVLPGDQTGNQSNPSKGNNSTKSTEKH